MSYQSITQEQEEQLEKAISELERPIVALSGGIDSSLLAVLVYKHHGEDMIAITGLSDAVSQRDREYIDELTPHIGGRHKNLNTDQLSMDEYVENDENRCFYCKFRLFEALFAFRKEEDYVDIVEGTNVDDLGDYRPGLKAAERFSIKSPFVEAGLHKADIYALAKELDVPNNERAASPCLSSRIAYGVQVKKHILEAIDSCEEYVRSLGIDVVRLRYLGDDAVRLEVLQADLEAVQSEEVEKRLLSILKEQKIQCNSIDISLYRRGSLNEDIE